MHRRAIAAIASLVLVVTAAAYFSAGANAGIPALALPLQARAAPPAGTVEACTLLKKEDAAVALGGTVTGPKATGPLSSGPGATVTACQYTGSGYLSVQLNVTRLPADQVAIYRGTCVKAGKEGLAGLGDVACWYNDKHEELHVFKANAFISIELRGKSNPTEAIKAVAKKVADQLW
jgi:hypothetical protein